MKTIEETRRELFEAWAVKERLSIERASHGGYYDYDAEGAWVGFNAALDAVCIELPESELDESRAVAIEDCRAAIESTNLGLRVK